MIIMKFDETRKYYVYVWYYVEDEKVFYVGKGTKYRYRSRKRDNPKLVEIINSCNCDSKIIESGLNEFEAFELEKKLISLYKSEGHPLINILSGGHKPPNHSGSVRSEETLIKMSEGMKKFHELHPEISRRQSEKMKVFLQTKSGQEFQRKSIESRDSNEFRIKQSERCRKANNTDEYKERQSSIVKKMWESDEYRLAHTGKANHAARAVKQFSMNDEFIAEYDTMTEASKSTGILVSRISAAAIGTRKTAGGYKWRYSSGDGPRHIKSTFVYNVDNDKNAVPILQYNKTGEFIAEYKSVAEAARINNFKNRSNIIGNLKGRTKSAYGYVWKYKHGNTVPSQDN